MILDSKVNFKNHLSEKISKANKGIGTIRRLYKFLPRASLVNIYRAFVRPHLDYGDIIYDNSSNATFSHIKFLQPFRNYTENKLLQKLQKQHVTKKGIQQQALELYQSTIKGETEFHASKGWMEKFMRRYSLSLRKKDDSISTSGR